jgi:hypothetical protein
MGGACTAREEVKNAYKILKTARILQHRTEAKRQHGRLSFDSRIALKGTCGKLVWMMRIVPI